MSKVLRRSTVAIVVGAAALLVVLGGLVNATRSEPLLGSPVPTDELTLGPEEVTLKWVPTDGSFGNGLLYLPADRSARADTVAIVIPGFGGRWDTVSWIGPQLASRGIPAFQLETQREGAEPEDRAVAATSAIQRLRADTELSSEVNPSRIIVIGHSMGGGAALHLAAEGSIAGAVAMAPWVNVQTNIAPGVPALVISCEADSIAPFKRHGDRILRELADGPYLWTDLAGLQHDCPTNRKRDPADRAYLITAIVDFIDYARDPKEATAKRACDALEEPTASPGSTQIAQTKCVGLPK
jgi:dienelactone hydrolase